MGWQNSRRRDELPANWQTIRATVFRRDSHRCTIRGPRCTLRATDIDHIGDRHDHQPANLRAACAECHRDRTVKQGHDAMRAIRAAAKHPRERHPGLT